MLQSQLFYKSTKEKSHQAESASHELLLRAGFIDQVSAGVYSFLPLGFLVLKNIEAIIRTHMQAIGAQEVLLPVLQPKENWLKTDRWNTLDILFKLKGSGDKEYVLGPTHEEVIAPLAKKNIFSYRDLPLALFQIQTKFRDELRAKSGLLRTKEFLMKDLYSFHSHQDDLEKYYEKMVKVYLAIFKELGIGKITYVTFASGGSFSKYSHEFQMLTEAGEDIIYICQKCQTAINKEVKGETPVCPTCGANNFVEKKAVEVGNIFKLGTKYSLPFEVTFKDKDGEEKSVVMGCYGIGLGRAMGAIVEANHDEKGIVWPLGVAPFKVHLIQLGNTAKVKKAAKKIYKDLSGFARSSAARQAKGIQVLYDDREVSAGEKFAESDLLGIPYRIVVSEKTLEKKSVEVKQRNKNSAALIKIPQIVTHFI